MFVGICIVWDLGVDTMLQCTSALSKAKSRQLATDEYHHGKGFNEVINRIVWLPHLEALEFDVRFEQSMTGITWPASLTEIKFGPLFKQSITAVRGPQNLKQLSFGWGFDQPITEGSN